MVMYGRNQHNTVKQLSSNLKKKKKDFALPLQGAWIPFLVGVLRSQMQGDKAKRKKDKNLTRLQNNPIENKAINFSDSKFKKTYKLHR